MGILMEVKMKTSVFVCLFVLTEQRRKKCNEEPVRMELISEVN